MLGNARARVVLWIALLAVGSCVAPRTEGRECVFSRDCAQGLICAGSFCRAACADVRDCMTPNVCRPSGETPLTACLPPDSPQPCATVGDCPSTARCEEKYCRWTCASDARCVELRAGTCDVARGYCTQRVRAGDSNPQLPDAGDASSEAAVDAVSDQTEVDASAPDTGVEDSATDAGTIDSGIDAASMDAVTDAPLVCPSGRMNCDGDPANGCEVDVTSDPNHCGACGMLCNPPANGTRACVASTCAIGACNAGFGDCDRVVANGCETALAGNRAHCGRCGNACPSGAYCGPFMTTFACQTSSFPPGDAGAPFVPDAGVVVSDGGDAGATITTLVNGRNVFESVTIPANAEVRSASGVLEIFSDGVVRIDGVIDVSGGAGGDAVPTTASNTDCRASGQGGSTGTRVAGISSMGGACPPVSTGGSGAAGQTAPVAIAGCSLGGAFGGGNGAGGTPAAGATAGGGGGGYAGGGGGGVRGSTRGGNGASAGSARGGPGGGTVADAGFAGLGGEYDAPTALAMYAGGNAVRDDVEPYCGGGGGSIGLDAANDLEVRTTFRPGSGGGGGAFSSCTLDMGGAAGGGGGGGALRIVSNTAIVLGPTARLLAVGGAGGRGIVGSANRGGGGGGSGGVIYLSAPSVVVEPGAIVDVRGGALGDGRAGQHGGAGGLGRIRIAVLPASCDLRGSFFPAFATGTPCEMSVPGGVPGKTFVGPFPPPSM